MNVRRVLPARPLALLFAAGAVLGTVGTTAHAQTSSLGGFTLLARAPGFEMTYDTPTAQTHPEGQGTVPQTLANLSTGPIGFGQSAIVWPGTLLGNLGSTVIIGSGGQAPQQFTALNDPVRAEARAPGGPADSSYTNAPGATMTAHADAETVHSVGNLRQVDAPGTGSTGSVASDSKVTLSQSLGTAASSSKVSNIVLGPAGLITIDSVQSQATATTDGVNAKASGKTTVSGFKVLGQPATVDDTGVHFGPANDPLNKQLNDAAAKALSKAGFVIVLSQPSGTPNGPAVDYSAGSLVIVWTGGSGAQAQQFGVTLGGAFVSVNSSPGFDVSQPTTDTGAGTSPDLGSSGPPTAGVVPSSSSGPVSAPSNTPASAAPSTPSAVSRPLGRQQARPISYFGGVAPVIVALVLVGGAAAGFGMRKLSTEVLAETPTACPLERGPT